MKFGLEMPGVPPSMNQWTRSHWSIRRKISEAWRNKIMYLSHGKKPPGWDCKLPCRVTLTFHCNSDPDNMIKFVMDGLTSAGIIKDDRYPYVHEQVIRQRPAPPKEHRTSIEVEQLNGD